MQLLMHWLFINIGKFSMSNSSLLYSFNLSVSFIGAFLLLVGFYYSFKLQVFKLAPVIAKKTKLIHNYPFSQVVGTVELSSVAVSHVLFCSLLIYNLKSACTRFLHPSL